MLRIPFNFSRRSLRVMIGLAPAVCLLAGTALARYETQLYVDKSDIQSFFGTDKAKMVYTNRSKGLSGSNTIEYVDFSEENPAPKRLENVPAGFLPVVSPDGRWVVYTDTYDGEAGGAQDATSSIFICELTPNAQPVKLVDSTGHEPRFVYNTQALGAEYDQTKLMVVYPTKSPDQAWEGIGETRIIEVDTAGGTPVPGTIRTLHAGGSHTGGLSYDGNYLCGGGGLAAMTNLTTGMTKTVGPIGYPGDNRFSGQACNASISSDEENTDHLMFLDFGSAGSQFTGVNGGLPWDQWQIIFIGDMAGNLISHYTVPRDDPDHPFEIPDSSQAEGIYFQPGWTRWHHPEWSNHPAFAAATVNIRRLWGFNCNGGMICSSEKQERIYFINLNTGSYLNVIGPAASELEWDKTEAFDGLFWPYLWVDKESAPVKHGVRDLVGGRGFAQIRNGVLVSRSNVVSVEVFGPRGRLIRSQRLSTPRLQVGIGSLRAGAYTVRVQTAEGLSQTLRHFVVK